VPVRLSNALCEYFASVGQKCQDIADDETSLALSAAAAAVMAVS